MNEYLFPSSVEDDKGSWGGLPDKSNFQIVSILYDNAESKIDSSDENIQNK
jgi:hypothetical protein